VDVSEPASISTGIAARYATAMFELAQEGGALDALEADVAALEAAMADSTDLRDLISSPIYGRDETQAAIGGVADAMGLNAVTGNTLRLMAQKRRLFVLPALLRELRERIATADVVSAKALTVDESLIGGLVVKVGSL
jgi:F-type H+-transporting ATPase subunit delta